MQHHRMVVGVGRDLCGSPSPAPCPSRVTQSRLHSTVARRVLNISREGDSTTSLGSLGQGSITLRGKKFFLMFRWNFFCFSLQNKGGCMANVSVLHPDSGPHGKLPEVSPVFS